MKKVGIVGYGNIGTIHAKALENVENARLYAVCDINAARRSLCREMYGTIDYEDYDEMLKNGNVDCVHICTPHYLHFEMISKALKAGKDVVVEKPVTMTKEEFEALQNIEGVEKVAVVMQNRLNPCVQKLKNIVQSKELGLVKATKAILTWHRDKEYYEQDNWRGKWATEGGGLLINQAIHTLDLFSYLVGDIRNVKAHLCNYSLQEIIEVEDTLSAYLEFDNDVKGIFFATNAYSENSDIIFEIVFEKGIARYMDKQLWIDGTLVEEDKKNTAGKTYWGSGHEEMLRNYYDKQQYFSVSDVTNTMSTMFAIYEERKHAL